LQGDPSHLIDIAHWQLDEEFGIFPVGSKPKRAVFCPTPAPYPFLIAGHRYLFKASKGWRTVQHWSEIIADELAQMCDLSAAWPAPGSEDTELGIFMEPEVGHGEAEVHARVQA
jgi:hypothetical protein